MKQEKDIFDLFRENEHKLDQAPPRRAWNRLEQKLDAHRNRRQKRWQFPRFLSIAAAVVGLVALLSLISFLFQTNKSMDTASAMPEFIVEDLLASNDDLEPGFYKIVEFQHKYNDRLANPIKEGSRKKKLIPSFSDTPVKMEQTDREPTLLAVAPKATEAKREEIGQAKKQKKNLENTPTKDNALTISSPAAAPSQETLEPSPQIAAGAQVEEDIAVAKTEVKPASKDKSATRARANAIESLSNADYNYADAENSVDGVPVPNGIQDFQWLRGRWSGLVNNQTSVEQWKQIDARTLSGTGFLLVDGQSTFVEGMRIQQIGSKVYFIGDLDGSGNQRRYELIEHNEQEAIFENKNVDFPKQVIIRKTNANSFMTIYQNAQPAAVPNQQQQLYLNNRNMIFNQQVLRNLNRVED